METKKVLIIDPDVIVRCAFSQVLKEDTSYTVYASDEISNPEALIKSIAPDLAFVSIRSSDTDVLAPFTSIHNEFPDLPIVVLSNRTEQGALAAIEALMAGSVDFVTKPEHNNSVLFAERHLRKRMLPIVRAITGGEAKSQQGVAGAQSSFYRANKIENGDLDSLWPLSVIVMASCMGGPVVLKDLLMVLPEDFPVPIVIVQHFPRIYTSVLAQKLDSITAIKVSEAHNGAQLEPGMAWIVPGGYHCEISRDGMRPQLRIHRGPRYQGLRPSANLTFRSAGEVFGPGVLGVILSGHGTDGVAGAGIIQQVGGQVVAQDPKTAIAAEMPQSVIDSGYCDGVFSVGEIAEQIIKRARNNPYPRLKKKDKQSQSIPTANLKNIDMDLFRRSY